MRLILLRHGRAGRPDLQRWPNDDDRPLTNGGRKRLIKAARGLRQAGTPDRVYASPSTRTMQTAQVMEQHAGWPTARPATWLNDGAEPQEGIDQLNKIRKRVKTVAV